MSRTIRRVNQERAQPTNSRWKWSKLHGWYGENYYYTKGVCELTIPNARQRFEKWYLLHGDKSSHFDPPYAGYRKRTRRREKHNYKLQYQRWLKNPDFEIISQMKLASCNIGYY